MSRNIVKRVLKNLLVKLKIEDVTVVHARAEDYIKNLRESFDIALSRAVASIPTLSEYLIPYVKLGGKILMYKGNKIEEEISIGEKAIEQLGGKIKEIKKYYLNEVESNRFILIINKVAITDKKYPRGKNLPKTKPII